MTTPVTTTIGRRFKTLFQILASQNFVTVLRGAADGKKLHVKKYGSDYFELAVRFTPLAPQPQHVLDLHRIQLRRLSSTAEG
jgi:hypothetical protein